MDSSTASLIKGVLNRDPRSIAKAMSRAEVGSLDDRELFSKIFHHAGKAHTIGITGVPGSGKSTMVRALAQTFRAKGKTVGIVAIDPSSPFSGGAILGDRVRMGELAGDDGVFIRSMATRGNLGGLTNGCMETVDVLDAAGFDVILIETVGVGQDEVDIARSALSVLVVSAPGLGDDIQAIKAGVLEIADIHVVSKCDRDDAHRTVADLKAMQTIGHTGRNRQGWTVPVMATSAETGQGIDDLCTTILEHGSHLKASGEITSRMREIAEMRVLKAAEDIARKQVSEARNKDFDKTIDALVSQRAVDPFTVANQIMTSKTAKPDTTDTSVIYMVRSWIEPEKGHAYTEWLDTKHMREFLQEPGAEWARRVMLDQVDDKGWTSMLLIYGFVDRAALDTYMVSPSRDQFWLELEAMKDIHYSERFWGDIDLILETQS